METTKASYLEFLAEAQDSASGVCKTSIPDLLHTFEKPDPCHTARIFKVRINGGMEPPEEPPAVNFAFVILCFLKSVLLPNGTPDVHFRVACGGQKLRDIMLDSNIELYGPYVIQTSAKLWGRRNLWDMHCRAM
ncbi:unnamed protein product [Camellia sinensis]